MPVPASVFAADWVTPIVCSPIRDGAVAIEGSRVAWVGPLARLPGQFFDAVIDRRHGVITPGLVNAHTHLQYSRFADLGKTTTAELRAVGVRLRCFLCGGHGQEVLGRVGVGGSPPSTSPPAPPCSPRS